MFVLAEQSAMRQKGGSAMNEKRWWCCNAEYGEHEPTCQNAALSPVGSEPLFGTCETCETWEGRLVIGCSKALLGYCNMFDKLTKHCTANTARHISRTPRLTGGVAVPCSLLLAGPS